jgi:hypothetical protein
MRSTWDLRNQSHSAGGCGIVEPDAGASEDAEHEHRGPDDSADRRPGGQQFGFPQACSADFPFTETTIADLLAIASARNIAISVVIFRTPLKRRHEREHGNSDAAEIAAF